MVFFTCNFCNESIKKKQVDKHLMHCRRCVDLSCVDCGKVFSRQSYQSHIKCISEEEKYSGPNFKPRAAANKGEKKQEEWTDQVQSAIDRCQPKDKMIHNILVKIRDMTNVPRKKAKFNNFARNIFHYTGPNIIDQVWNLISLPSESKKTLQSDQLETAKETELKSEEDQSVKNGIKRKNEEPIDDQKNLKKEKSKKRKKNKSYKDNGDGDVQEIVLDAVEESTPIAVNGGRLNDTIDPDCFIRPDKFDWIATMLQLINKKGEISLKKLRKKTIAEFLTYPEASHTDLNDAKIGAKFDKIVRKKFVVEDKYVKIAANN